MTRDRPDSITEELSAPDLSLVPPSPELAGALRGQLAAADYTEAGLMRLLGFTSPMRLDPDDLARAGRQLRNQGVLGALIRLFFLEQTLSESEYSSELPADMRDALDQTGLLAQQQEGVAARVLLVPIEGFVIAGDRYQKLPGSGRIEHVLCINPPARLLANLAVRRPVGRLLDLCTGNGVFAAVLAGHARRVTATDLNPRALALARFNFALNETGQVELHEGSLFEPLAGERFDQVICNPPYIITPTRRLVSTESDEELDGLCRTLVRQAPAYLNEGGILQMICEWVDGGEEDWRHYLSKWFEGLGCDAWAICAGLSPIEDYAQRRRTQALAAGASADADTLADWLEYFRARGVKGIRSGFIQLRRRSGSNWESYTSLATTLPGPVSDDILAGFATRDRFAALGDADILRLSPQRVPALTVDGAGGDGAGVRLVKTQGLPVSFTATPAMARLIELLDGVTELVVISHRLADQAGIDRDLAGHECARAVRELLCQGLLQVPGTG